MKQVVLLIAGLFLFSPIQSQFVIDKLSCDDVKVRWDGIPFSSANLFNQAGVWPCGPNEFRAIAGASITRFSYQLQRLQGAQFVNTGNPTATSATQLTFNDLSDGTYRVMISIRASDNLPVFSNANPCGPPIGERFNNNNSGTEVSETFEIGDLNPAFFLGDANFNNIFCDDDVDNAGGIYMNTTGTFGETGFAISICLRDQINPSNCYAWTSTYWQPGQVPTIVNLLTDVWQLHHPGWEFWGDGERIYEVQLAVNQSNCNSWESYTETFKVVDNGNCRIGENKKNLEITLFPNPVSDQFRIRGLEAMESSISYRIMDMSGRAIVSEELVPFNHVIDVSHYSAGIYVISINVEDQIISKRFSVIK